MNSRPLTAQEVLGLTAINEMGIPSVAIFVTATGLRKSILDATEPARAFLFRHGIHDYGRQKQGPDHKVVLSANVIEPHSVTAINVSLYRPATKMGDPRLWPSGLARFARPNDIILMGAHNGTLMFFNLTLHDIAAACKAPTVLSSFLNRLRLKSNEIAAQLLGELRNIAQQGPLRATCEGSTAIGRAIESALGIQQNSDKNPDYRGIEIKSGRAKSGTRSTLFACVPDWGISACKSSAEILDVCGYDRDGVNKLYCTVSSQKANSQGLILTIDETLSLLRESMHKHGQAAEIAVWRLPRLEQTLLNKHRETFWIRAESTRVNGVEQFQLISVVHTKSPNTGQLSRLLGDGGITVDHLIKRLDSGSVRERGPLFKIQPKRIAELFLGQPQCYDLRTI